MILTLKELRAFVASVTLPDDAPVGIAADPTKEPSVIWCIDKADVLPPSDFPGSKAMVVFTPTFGR